MKSEIVCAIRAGDLNFLRRFISTNASSLDALYQPHGWTLLHYLAALGKDTLPVHAIMADELIRAGANINCRTVLGWTPIHMIAMQGQKEAVELAKVLIARGADLAAVDKHGADWKIYWQHGEEIRHLLEAERSISQPVLRKVASSKRLIATGTTAVIRWTAYVFVTIGLLLFMGTYIATFMREGAGGVLARFFNPFHDVFLALLCFAPGLLLLGWAESRTRKAE